jgi:GNAT superfamily N-acetyltransferase
MVEEIRQTEALTEDEKHQLFGWGENIFGVESLKLRWRPKDLHFLLYSGSRPVSHVGVLKHEVSVAGHPRVVGGVGGVVTVPEAQKTGCARRLMEHAAEFFRREWKVDAGLLFCRTNLEPYYEALGWQTVAAPVLIEQPNGQIGSPLSVMILILGGQCWLHETIELRSLPW